MELEFQRSWILAGLILFLKAGLLATSHARDCNLTHVIHCYDTLTHYEGLGFPFYGRDHLDLVETCRLMNDSFACVDAYVDWCKERRECDEECEQMIEDIVIFNNNTGLKHAQKELCNPKSSLRQAYLENYSCLESNEENYAACHNVSIVSQEYMASINDPKEGMAARCCFFTWFHDCFTNITRDNCNVNATLFVSLTLHNLLSQMSLPLCGPSPDVCDTPPLPHHHHHEEGEVTDPLLEEHDVTDVDNSLEREHRNWDDSPKKINRNFTEEDNSLESQPKSPGSSHTYSLWTISMSFFILLSCYML